MYAFLFDRKSLILVSVGICLAGLLLFGAGLMTGARLGLGAPAAELPWAPQRHEVATTQPPPSSSFELAIPLDDDLAIPQSEPSTPATRQISEPTPVSQPSWPEPQPAAAPSSATPASVPPPPPPASVPPPPASIESTSPPKPAAQGAQTEPATLATSTTAQPAASAPQLYSVQVGAYRYRANAERRVAKLERYAPYVEVIENDHGDLLYTVRIGSYDSRQQAEATAAAIGLELEGPAADDEEVLVRPILAPPTR